MHMEQFHPAVRDWFKKTFAAPTPAQLETWPAIKSGSHALIAAPTGSGKTLAAFLAAIDNLVWQGVNGDLFGRLEDETRIVYVSPLKALSNDIHKNLEIPLTGIRDELLRQGVTDLPIRTMVRTGDTTQSERERMRRQPPHILVTTPESLYILLTSDSGRRVLSTAHTLIVDEIHALAGNKRGSHLCLSMERLQDLCARPLTRIGLSATQTPIELAANFLTGAGERHCAIIDTGHMRDRDLAIEVTGSPLEAVMSTEAWTEVYQQLTELIDVHRTTLVFVNTRRLAERVAKALSERIGEDAVTSHHGSLAREHRLDAERRLKAGSLRALVATASLELGIDIGDIDLVCQIGSPRTISTFLQRVGRSGHGVESTPKGRLFPTTRDDLAECVALLDAVRRGELDQLEIPEQPLDVLAQQLVAEVSCGEREEERLFEQVRRAWPYRSLSRHDFDTVVSMLADGFSTRRGRRSAWVHRDAVNRRLRPRRSAQLVALLNGGAIPDMFDYDVILQPQGFFVGTLNEDFAFESLPGDIFQLGNTSYRILKTERGKVHVEDAHGQPPNIPFWFGEAPGRSDELSKAVSRLRHAFDRQLTRTPAQAIEWSVGEFLLSSRVAGELVEYLTSARAALGRLPTRDCVVFERFFDEAGDQHLVIHAPFGARLNRAWGLALRKRFCRKFNFELQAAALEDSIVISLGNTHSFPLAEVANYLKSTSVRELLTQALLNAPMFATRWRWNATISLGVQRNRNGQRVPPQFQRMDSEDLLAVVFPDQLACQDNMIGKREIPDHPLVQQTISDCLHEVMDVEGLEVLLASIEHGEVKVITRELAGPSPLAQEVLTARPYAFLDDAPAEERRTQLVQARCFANPEDAAQLGALDPEAIARVRVEAWPDISNSDELHDALLVLGCLTEEDLKKRTDSSSKSMMDELIQESRATVLALRGAPTRLWVCAERLALWQTVFPDITLNSPIKPVVVNGAETRQDALLELVRGRLEASGPTTAGALAHTLCVSEAEIEVCLLKLEAEGFAMRGHFNPAATHSEWCERGLLARIHRYTVKRLREEIKPVSRSQFMRFLLRWQGLDGEEHNGLLLDENEGPQALMRVLGQLEGYEAPAAAWESQILPLRLPGYREQWLDNLGTKGHVMWLRLRPCAAQARAEGHSEGARPTRFVGPVRTTPVALITRRHLAHWCQQVIEPQASSIAQRVLEHLEKKGASFLDDICTGTGLLHTQTEQALAELAALGLVSADSFAGLRALLRSARRHGRGYRRGRRHRKAYEVDVAGRWSRIGVPSQGLRPQGRSTDNEAVEHIAQVLLRRYGIVFRRLLEREVGLPSWRDLLYVYRRMEARGDVRGGRFVDGFSGEQFGLPEAIGLLRDVRRRAGSGRLVSVSAADPLNLVSIVLTGERVPALTNNRILYRDGEAVALLVGGKMKRLAELDNDMERKARNALLQRTTARYQTTDPVAVVSNTHIRH